MKRIHYQLLILILAVFPNNIYAGLPGKLKISGAFMGVMNVFQLKNASSTAPKRQQADVAINLDFAWQLRPNMRGTSLTLSMHSPAVVDFSQR